MPEVNDDDLCSRCGHRAELHYFLSRSNEKVWGSCRYLHPHSGACGSHGGVPPYGNGNVVQCTGFAP